MTGTHRTALRIGADHPTLAGHFPGDPIVPGVVLLDLVQAAAEVMRGSEFTSTKWSQVKFLMPLRAEVDAWIELEPTAGSDLLRFRVLTASGLVSSGEFGGSGTDFLK